MQCYESVSQLSDAQLIEATHRITEKCRRATALLLAHLAEMDRRKLYLAQAQPSLFQYTVDVLGFSESEAYMRITAARTAEKYPEVYELVATGALHLTAIKLVAPHLTGDNRHELLAAVSHKNKRAIELELAHRFARPDVPQVLRKLPKANKAAVASAPAAAVSPTALPAWPIASPDSAKSPPADPGNSARSELPEQKAQPPTPPARPTRATEPLAPQRFKLQLTISAKTQQKLEQAQQLLGHRVVNGDLVEVLDYALDALLEKEMKRKYGVTDRPREQKSQTTKSQAEPAPKAARRRSRHIPHAVRREVLARDGLQCAFVSETGQRCPEKSGLELHHDGPFGKGGAHHTENIKNFCKAHNCYAAEQDYGTATMARYRRSSAMLPKLKEAPGFYLEARAAAVTPGFSIRSGGTPEGSRGSLSARANAQACATSQKSCGISTRLLSPVIGAG